ncbi:MAG: hypothetical protein Q7U07_01590 [Gammaproteobacteria bacterium]|nr:hypothetical protein [Gammaproteobacteria bacterium]
MFDFLKLKSEISSVAGKVRGLRAEAEKLKRQREDLATAPATKEDTIRLMLAQIDEAAARYPARLRAAIDHNTTCGQPSNIGSNGRPNPVGIFTAREHQTIPPSIFDVQDCLCFVLQGQLKPVIELALKDTPWPDGAQPVEGRAAALEKLDREIANLDAEETNLRQAAAAAGVVI